ncbi:MAG: type III pantothenate kinase [Saprospiraceae bacterium]|jgi:type III pantothenate kinase
MFLAIDIGNSNVVAGLYLRGEWKEVWRFQTTTEAGSAAYYANHFAERFLKSGLRPQQVDQVVLSSVVPNLNTLFLDLIRQFFDKEAILVGPHLYPYLDMDILRPNEIGTDLVANSVGALSLYQQDCIIVDFGTALTFTTVTRRGEILGVAIAPGLKTAVYALFDKTAQLPEVPLELPETPIGKNTAHAIQSGVLRGYVGLVTYMVEDIRKEAGSHFIAVATGGLSAVLHPLQGVFHAVNPNLTLDGLREIGARVSERTGGKGVI